MVTRQILADAHTGHEILDTGVPVQGQVTGIARVVTQIKVLLKGALLHVVHIYTQGYAAAVGAVKPFPAHPRKHGLQNAAVHTVKLLVAQLAHMGEL